MLIVDWDIHHGNGIQRVFKDDHRVLYISLHRGDIFPYQGESIPTEGDSSFIGSGVGTGFNVNIAWPEVLLKRAFHTLSTKLKV